MDDDQIVNLYWIRDPDAISETEAKYGRYCAYIAGHILASPEDREECVNDTWLKAWDAMPPHRPAVLPTFLGKITRRLALNRYAQSRALRRGGGETALVLEELAECVPGGTDPEGEAARRALVGAIDGFLAGLPERKCNLFLWRYWYAVPVAEIAARAGMTPGGVSVALHRLRGQLRNYLTERGLME